MNVIKDASALVRIAAPEAKAALGLGRVAGQMADDVPRALHALDDVKTLGGVAQLANKSPLGAGDAIAALAVEPHRLNALRLAESQGARVINRASAIEHVQAKGAMSSVLDAAGVHNSASGTMTRTADEVRAAVDSFGGKAHITGGFSQSRIAPKVGEGHAIVDTALGTPRPVNIHTADELEKFIASSVDRERAFLVQAPITGQAGEMTVVGDKVVHASGKTGSLSSLAPAEHEQAVKAVKAFGLDTGAVTVERGTDGAMRVRDVLPAPVGKAARSQVQTLAKDSSALLDAVGSTAPSTAIADSLMASRPSIGVANMGRVPGKNISRVMAEVEKQGANPVFMPLKTTSVAADGTTVLFAGKPAPKMDAIITRTGAVIDDAGIATLKDLEKSGQQIVNRGSAMELVRDKNIQAKTLIDAGIAHPLSTTVDSPADVQKAVDLIGDSMVLKNPASSEGRGVMFLEGRDTIDGVAQMFHKRTASSTLVAESMRPGEATATRMALNGRDDAERAIRELGGATLQRDAALGVDQLQMAHPVKLLDPATGASTTVKKPVSLLTVTDAFHDAKPGATLKAEHWFTESAGVDTRIHVMRNADGEFKPIAAMSRHAQPSIYGEARSNLSIGGYAKSVKLTPEEEKMAAKAAEAFDLDVAGIDILTTKKGPVVLEVNSSPGLDIEDTVGAVADKWVDLALNKARNGAKAGV